MEKWIRDAWVKIENKLERTSRTTGDALFAYTAKNGKFIENPDIFWWTNGFWQRIMRLSSSVSNYRLTGQKNSTPDNYFLGIDGGGTKTKFVLADSNDSIVSQVVLGPSNPNDIGMEMTKKVLENGIREACGKVDFSRVVMFAGISGGITGDNCSTLSDFFKKFGFKNYQNASDVNNLISLGLGKSDGVAVIMGTGIIGFAKKGNVQKQIGGWGQFFDAGGGGYNFGRDAIYAALREYDGIGEKTKITELLSEQMGMSVNRNLSNIYVKGKEYIASFAPIVFKAAQYNDTVAKDIICSNMSEVAKIINAAARFVDAEKLKVAFAGSLIINNKFLLEQIKKDLSSEYKYEFDFVTDEPVYGAIKLAKEIV